MNGENTVQSTFYALYQDSIDDCTMPINSVMDDMLNQIEKFHIATLNFPIGFNIISSYMDCVTHK